MTQLSTDCVLIFTTCMCICVKKKQIIRINRTPMDLSIVVKVFKTLQHLSQYSRYGHFIKNAS